MEDSGYNSLMLGVYVFIFLIATSLTVYLFSTTVTVADKAFEYGKVTTGDSVIETTSAPKYSIITGAELLTYYYNYKSPDKYGTANTPNYDFSNINDVGIDINRSYALIYESANTGSNPVITVRDITPEVGTPTSGEIIPINNQPSDPTIITYPNTDSRVMPNTVVEMEAHSYVNVSFATNVIVKYYWRIDYSPEDGRPDFTATTTGQKGELTELAYGNVLKFVDGTNRVYVTSEDAFGNKSNTISKEIKVGYNDPVINYVKEMDNKVINYGAVDMDSPTGASLRFITDATSKNPGGFIQKYDWTLNGTLVQSGASERLIRSFAPGSYSLTIKVYDSIKGTAETTFAFTVNKIPTPTIICSNTAITTNRTLAITDSTVNLTFNSSTEAKYDVVRYVWNVDGTVYNAYVPNGINLNYGIGTHTVSVYAVNSAGLTSDTRTLTFTITQDFVPFEQEYYSNGSYHTVTLPAGKYVFETWGARGGNGSGGYGGYSTGQLNISSSTTFYIYVGSSAGYNGGGNSMLSYSKGGGATDIRLNNGAWSDAISLRSRIIVAGGGGGNGGNSTSCAGGSSGGLYGYTGGDLYGNPGTGAGQTYGGSAGRLYAYGATNGSFGIGGNAETASNTSAGAGGGGYYGGGGGSSDYSNYNDLDDSGGGGGSSFISGYPGCDAVNASGIHTGQASHYSGLTFINASMTAGYNSGEGKAKITRVR